MIKKTVCLFLFIFLLSCQEKEQEESERPNPSSGSPEEFLIKITSPQEGQFFRSKQVDIVGDFSYPSNSVREEIEIKVNNRRVTQDGGNDFKLNSFILKQGDQQLVAQLYYKKELKAEHSIFVSYSGKNKKPHAILMADPMEGKSPLAVQFDATKSFDIDGSIERYFWTIDGIKEETTSPFFEKNLRYVLNGCVDEVKEVEARLEVVDDEGEVSKSHKKIVKVYCEPNSPPVPGDDQSFTINEDNKTVFVLNSAIDADGDPLTYNVVSPPLNGSLEGCLDGTASTSCEYIPNKDFFGSETITYVVNDGLSDSLTLGEVNVEVNAVNDAPVMVEDQYFEIDENESLTFTLAGATDVDSSGLTYSLATPPNDATIIGCLDGTGSLKCTLTPRVFFAGEITFSYKANDGVTNSVNAANVKIKVNNTIPDDFTAPTVAINPATNSVFKITIPLITVNYSDDMTGIDIDRVELWMDDIMVNDHAIIEEDKALLQFTSEWPLSDGDHRFYVEVYDYFGNKTTKGAVYTVKTEKITTAYITGRVYDTNGSPIVGATISDTQSPVAVEISTITDENGEFKLPFEVEGDYLLRAEKEGYTDGSKFVTTIKGRDSDLGTIVLATADPMVTPISAATGGTASNSTGSITATFAPGALANDIDFRATEFTEGNSLPAALPELSAFTYAFDPQPRGFEYNSSEGGYTFANSLGFPEGTKLVYGFYYEDLGRWMDSGLNIAVSSSNKLQLNGVMSLPPRSLAGDINQPVICGSPCDPPSPPPPPPPPPSEPQCIGCRINIFTGDLAVDHELPMIRRFNSNYGLTFTYTSTTARPNFFVSTGLVNNFPEPADSVEAKISLGNKTVTVETAGEAIMGESLIRLLVEGTNADGIYLPTGSYSYSAELSTLYTDSEYATATFFGAPALLPLGVLARVPLRFRSESCNV